MKFLCSSSVQVSSVLSSRRCEYRQRKENINLYLVHMTVKSKSKGVCHMTTSWTGCSTGLSPVNQPTGLVQHVLPCWGRNIPWKHRLYTCDPAEKVNLNSGWSLHMFVDLKNLPKNTFTCLNSSPLNVTEDFFPLKILILQIAMVTLQRDHLVTKLTLICNLCFI